MAEPRTEAERPASEFGGGGAATAESTIDTAAAVAERTEETAEKETERFFAGGRQGLRQVSEVSQAGAQAALRSGVTMADGVREIAATWARYAEEVMRHSSQAGQALLRCRSWNEILEVQAGLLRDNMRSFLDQSAKVAEIGSRMATRPLEALTEAAGDRPR